jgi:hypothetical protein
MEAISAIMTIIAVGVGGYGGFLGVMGAVEFGSALSEENGPGRRQAILKIVGGVIIVAAAVYFKTIKFTE